MAETALEELQRDRIQTMLGRNVSLARACMGLMRAVLRQSDKYGWDSTRLAIRLPHLSPRVSDGGQSGGFLEFRYRPCRAGGARYRQAMSAADIPTLRMQENASIVRFLHYCRPMRHALESIYEQSYAFAFDRAVPFEGLDFGSFHLETARRRAWCWVARNDADSVGLAIEGVF